MKCVDKGEQQPRFFGMMPFLLVMMMSVGVPTEVIADKTNQFYPQGNLNKNNIVNKKFISLNLL